MNVMMEKLKSVWVDGSKAFKLSENEITNRSIPIAQLVCQSHANELPTQQEFENLADWLIKQGSREFTLKVLDFFKSTFIGMLDEPLRDIVFAIPIKSQYGKLNPKQRGELQEIAISKFLDKWGIKFDEVPNYYEGFRRLSGKFSEKSNEI